MQEAMPLFSGELKSGMKPAVRIWLVIVFLVGAWCLCVVWGHEYRTLNRLINARLVSNTQHCRRLYSTGHARESRHVFECASADILAADKGGIAFHFLDPEDGSMGRHFSESIRPLMDACIRPPVDWKKAEITHGDGRGLLSMLYRVNAGGRIFVVLEMF